MPTQVGNARFLLEVAMAFAISQAMNQLPLSADEPTISVSGFAEIRVVPNQATIHIAISSQAKTIKEATAALEKQTEELHQFLLENGLDEQSISIGFAKLAPVQPQQARQGKMANQSADPFGDDQESSDPIRPRTPVAFIASRSVSANVTELSKLNTIQKGVLELGLQHTIHFSHRDMDKFRKEAQTQAVVQARLKAEAMAGGLGASLSDIRRIEDSLDGFRDESPFGSSPYRSAVESNAGKELVIHASAQIVFGLENTKLSDK